MQRRPASEGRPLNPFNPNYVGQIAAAATTPKGRQASTASRRASKSLEVMRTSGSPRQRAWALGSIPGLGQTPDYRKINRILKPSKL